MFLTLALILATAPAYAEPTEKDQAAGSDTPIIVTGTRLEESRDALRACIDEGCPPLEDMALTLTHTENQFVAGDYAKARVTLRKGIERNKKSADDHPDAVAGLYRANSRLSQHLGNIRDYRWSAIRVRETLRDAYGRDDYRAIIADVAVADALLRGGYPEQAIRGYRRPIEQAETNGMPRIAAYATIRKAVAYLHMARSEQRDEYRRGLVILKSVTERFAASAPDMAMLADIQLWRITNDGDEGLDALIARYAPSMRGSEPFLVSAEPIDLGKLNRRDVFLVKARSASVGQTNNERWIDVGFIIDADGSTSQVEILSGHTDDNWAGLVTESIKTRRYTPLENDADWGGRYRVERFSLNQPVGGALGPGPTIVRLDLTEDQTRR